MPTFILTLVSLLAFAANSLLCRQALHHTRIDAATFTAVRLVAGACTLWVLTSRHRPARSVSTGHWLAPVALFIYAAAFSFAYARIPAAVGAMILFSSVQATMIGYGLWIGERLRVAQWAGLLVALGGFTALLLPGLTAPPLLGACLMTLSGSAWGVYSLSGRGGGDPAVTSARNFLRTTPLCVLMMLWAASTQRIAWDRPGLMIALFSGSVTSSLAYIVWYTALKRLRATTAAIVQLSVPVLAAAGATLFLHEPLSMRLVACAFPILAGIATVLLARTQPAAPTPTTARC